MNRRLAAAVFLSLGGHAVLLAVFGFGFGPGQKPELLIFDERHLNSLSASVTLSPPEKIQSDAGGFSESQQQDNVPEAGPAITPDPGSNVEKILKTTDADIPDTKKVLASAVGNVHPEGLKMAESSLFPDSAGDRLIESPTGPVDNDPVLLSSITPVYPAMARRAGLEGVVIIDVTVDRFGQSVEFRIQPPRCHKLLEESALAAVTNARFLPGKKAGKAVQDTFRIKVRFELDKT